MMTNDRILKMLAEQEKEAQQIPERWQALAEGRATPLQIARLQNEARSDPAAARQFERFRPLSTKEDQDLINGVLRATRLKPPAQRFRPLTHIVPLLALAAALLLIFVQRPSPALPAYSLEAATGDLSHRGSPEDHGKSLGSSLPEHHAESALSLALRPAHDIEGPIAIDAFIYTKDQVNIWAPPMEVAASGAVRIDGRLSDLLPNHKGPVTLLLAVRRASSRKIEPRSAVELWRQPGPSEGVRLIGYSFKIVGP